MKYYAYYEYIDFDNEKFFTAVLLPEKDGCFPTVISRSPYVHGATAREENELLEDYLRAYSAWLDRGYAVVFQHCRGQGKSSGAFVPYVHEREDGLALREWIRSRSFYNGELFLLGSSYSASLHYTTFPLEKDVLGAVLEVQDSERYRLWYRNGQMRKGHANWHFELYKKKCALDKHFSMASFSELPLAGLSERVLGDIAEDFEQMLKAACPTHGFWNTRFGGNDAKGVADNTPIPILFTTGYNDFYVGGLFKMWNSMSEEAKKRCALLVSPYDHGDSYSKEQGLGFPLGARGEQFGATYRIDWIDHIRKSTPLPYKKGVITYYRDFEDRWESDFYARKTEPLCIPLGEGVASFTYDPENPPAFSPEGRFQTSFSKRDDVITLYTSPKDCDIFVKGQMKASLTVSTSAPDTTFYMNISIVKPEGDYTLRHDITSLCYQLGDYTPNSLVTLEFCFDEHAFLLRKGESLRVDVSSTDDNTYVCHTNQKGEYYLQTKTSMATNKIDLSHSYVILPTEK